jgi:hypothetical protein
MAVKEMALVKVVALSKGHARQVEVADVHGAPWKAMREALEKDHVRALGWANGRVLFDAGVPGVPDNHASLFWLVEHEGRLWWFQVPVETRTITQKTYDQLRAEEVSDFRVPQLFV